jgi:hypothetical protein
MKIRISCPTAGNALLISLMLSAIIGVDMISYLSLVKSQNLSTMRSMYWNSAMAMSEAGVEEAIAHLNKNGTNGLLSNGWALLNGKYTLSRVMGDGYYTVTISQGAAPTIESFGYVALPPTLAYHGAGVSPFMAAVGLDEYTAGKQFVSRRVRALTTNSALLAKGIVARGQIDLRGNNMYSDSYDSADPLYSTNGLYTASRRKDNGDVATNSSLTNSLNVGNADIYGRVATGPGGSISIGPNGVVGTLAYITGGGTGIQPGRSSDDMNVAFPDATAPFTSAPAPSSGSVNGTNYTYVLGAGDHMLTSLSLSGQNKVIVTGNARLYVSGNVSMAGQSQIIIAPNASLKMYVAGASASLAGNGVANGTGNPNNFYFYGLPSNTSVSVSGNGSFTGVVYAPNADYSTVGNGEFFGAVVAKTATLTGNGNFHYDENLARVGPSRGFVVTSWQEF